MSHNPIYRAPIITIEGADTSINKILSDHLTHHIQSPTNTSQRYNENMSPIGFLVGEANRGYGGISDLVHYNLRIANLWELQPELRELSITGETVIFNNYILSNRAQLLKKGTVSLELCPQFESGLLKPDLQIFVKSDPETLMKIPSLFAWDTIQSRLELSKAFDKIAETYPNLHVINNNPENILKAAEDVINIYDQFTKDQLSKFSISSGTE